MEREFPPEKSPEDRRGGELQTKRGANGQEFYQKKSLAAPWRDAHFAKNIEVLQNGKTAEGSLTIVIFSSGQSLATSLAAKRDESNEILPKGRSSMVRCERPVKILNHNARKKKAIGEKGKASAEGAEIVGSFKGCRGLAKWRKDLTGDQRRTTRTAENRWRRLNRERRSSCRRESRGGSTQNGKKTHKNTFDRQQERQVNL